MSEQEIKEQISQDTNKWCRFMLESEEDYDPLSHEQGRIAQDKIATNRTVEAMIALIKTGTLDARELLYQPGWRIIKELEKLRR